ncbi:MAG: hypothetical protein A2X61_08570 [Ignavibacteria bacterium GWB2_35_12]|nr:MAG: hypothetical protein A2X61_08570 [Ignavibacteria bacterium GWB2_35_12]OGU87725.1 MAG: hypothetical protein A2220_02340 [Ignavibacteria bacterium RIFOXYA2_FULL_35_10]
MELVTLAKALELVRAGTEKKRGKKNFTSKLENLKVGVLLYFAFFLILTGRQIVYSQNNVGIGCTDPDGSAILELRSSTMGFLAPRMTLGQRPGTPVTGLLIYQTDNTAGFYYYDGTSWVYLLSGSYWSLSGNASTNPVNDFIGTSDAQDFVLRTNNLERARILSGGNFGIGTNNPSQRFEVSDGNILLTNTGAATELRFAEPGGVDYTAFKAQAQTANVTYTLPTADGSNGQALTTDGAGLLSWSTISGGSAGWTVGAGVVYNTTDNIGIGTSTPGQLLEVRNGGLLLSNSGTAGALSFAEPGGTDVTAFVAQAQTGSLTYTLPAGDGSSGQFLSTDGAGLLSWTTPSGSVPSGTSGQTLRYDAANALIATSFLSNDGTQVAVNDNNSGNQNPPFMIVQSGTGDASQRYYLSGGQSVSSGINNLDNDNFEISNTSSLSSTGAYSDANKMLRVHTEGGSAGIVDMNHQSRARGYLTTATSISSGTATWAAIPFDAESYDSQSEFDVSGNNFTAKEDGYYQVNARTEFEITGTPALGATISIAIFIDGSLYAQGNILQLTDNFIDTYFLYNCAPVVSDVIPLTAGQVVTIRVIQDTGASQNIKSGSGKTYVSVHKLS